MTSFQRLPGSKAIQGLAGSRLWAEAYELGLRQQLTLEPILGMPAGDAASSDPAVYGPALDVLLEKSGPTRASMLQDIERGRRSEVDVINGAVVARANGLGAQALHNQRVVELVHSFERGERVRRTLASWVRGMAIRTPVLSRRYRRCFRGHLCRSHRPTSRR